MAQPSISTLRRTTTHVTVGYLVVTATLVVWFRHSVDHWPIVVATHLAVAVLLTGFQRLDTPPAPLAVLRDWHPIVLFPLLYKEVETLAAAFGDWRLSDVVPSLEAALFGGQPSVYLSELWSSVAVSEYLHFCYLSYVSVIPGVAAYWYVTGRRRAFHELVLLLSIVLLCSYLFFILFPVDSPYYLAAPLDPPLSGHFFYEAIQALSSRGGARGGAFPSAHVSGAVVVWLVAWRHQRILASVLAPVIGGVILATVYGRFHYALDTIAGVLVAVAVVSVWSHVRSTKPGGASAGTHAARVPGSQQA